MEAIDTTEQPEGVEDEITEREGDSQNRSLMTGRATPEEK